MAKTEFKSVDEYIASQPKAVQGVLERVRDAIRNAVPDAEEVMSYKMPTYKVRGEAILHFAGWAKHYSLYAATDRVVAVFQDDLAPYEIKKGTIRVPLSQPMPTNLIERIAKFRAKEIAGRGAASPNSIGTRRTRKLKAGLGTGRGAARVPRTTAAAPPGARRPRRARTPSSRSR